MYIIRPLSAGCVAVGLLTALLRAGPASAGPMTLSDPPAPEYVGQLESSAPAPADPAESSRVDTGAKPDIPPGAITDSKLGGKRPAAGGGDQATAPSPGVGGEAGAAELGSDGNSAPGSPAAPSGGGGGFGGRAPRSGAGGVGGAPSFGASGGGLPSGLPGVPSGPSPGSLPEDFEPPLTGVVGPKGTVEPAAEPAPSAQPPSSPEPSVSLDEMGATEESLPATPRPAEPLAGVSLNPEPTSLTLVAVAVASLGGYAWRRRRQAQA